MIREIICAQYDIQLYRSGGIAGVPVGAQTLVVDSDDDSAFNVCASYYLRLSIRHRPVYLHTLLGWVQPERVVWT